MLQYIAFLRGIGPGNPNMRNEKLQGVFEDLGFKNVQTVISSGNVLFDSSSKNVTAMEKEIEKTWPEKLGFTSTTIIRSQKEIQTFIAKKPFGELEHSKETYLLVTFLKEPPDKLPINLPYQNEDKSYKVMSYNKELRALCSVSDTTAVKTPDFMRWLEKNFGKEISSRTWKTVLRIANKMEKQ
ncbi:MAG TPA: DUF1697 domain-containing protein [Salinimicrobium sp.]|nr:DUF1697 domain-containing protein [Salinimicrobium sp.]